MRDPDPFGEHEDYGDKFDDESYNPSDDEEADDDVLTLAALVPWSDRTEVAPDEEAAILSRIPLMAGDSKKMDYLCWRSTGFPVRQAAELAGISQSTVNKWRRADVFFRTFESERLPDLQRHVGADVLRLEFMRNFRLLLKQDAKVIWKAVREEDMTEREWAYYRQIRNYYKPAEFLNLEKALAPEKHRERPISINLTFGGSSDPERIEASEADFRELE